MVVADGCHQLVLGLRAVERDERLIEDKPFVHDTGDDLLVLVVSVHQGDAAVDVLLILDELAHILENDVVDFVCTLSVCLGVENKFYFSLGIKLDGSRQVFRIFLSTTPSAVFSTFFSSISSVTVGTTQPAPSEVPVVFCFLVALSRIFIAGTISVAGTEVLVAGTEFSAFFFSFPVSCFILSASAFNLSASAFVFSASAFIFSASAFTLAASAEPWLLPVPFGLLLTLLRLFQLLLGVSYILCLHGESRNQHEY